MKRAGIAFALGAFVFPTLSARPGDRPARASIVQVAWLAGSWSGDTGTTKVEERWTPTGPGVMRYEATITDPNTFTKPWKMSFNLYKRQGDDARLNQFKCVEFVEELMYGDLRKEPLK